MLEKDVATTLRNTHQKMSDIMRAKIAQRKLTFRLFHILILIKENPDTSQKYLAKTMRLTQGAMSGSIKHLLKLGFLKQVPLESDNRYNKLVITKKGLDVIEDHILEVDERFEKIFDNFSESELTDLNNYLNRVNTNLDAISQEDKEGVI